MVDLDQPFHKHRLNMRMALCESNVCLKLN
jgi:hypothetical protein